MSGLRAWLAQRNLRAGLLLAFTTILAALLLTDFSWNSIPNYTEGDVPDRSIVSSTTFHFVDPDATARRQQVAGATVPPVYTLDYGLPKARESQLSQAFDMARSRVATAADSRGKVPPEVLEAVGQDFEEAIGTRLDSVDLQILQQEGWSHGVEELALELMGVGTRYPVVQDRGRLPEGGTILVQSSSAGVTEESPLGDFSRIRSVDEAWQAIGLYVAERLSTVKEPGRVQVAAALAKTLIRPNLFENTAETERRRVAAAEAVLPVEVEVRKGKRIVRAGDPVTPQQAVELSALRQNDQHTGSGWMFLSNLVFVGVLITATAHFARVTIRKFSPRPNDLEALALTLLLVLGIGRVLAEGGSLLSADGTLDPSLFHLMLPVAGATMVVRVLVNSESALIFALVASLLGAAQMDRSALLAGWYLATSVVAAAAVGQGRERATVLRAGLQSGLIGAGLTVVMLLARQHGPGADLIELDTQRMLIVVATAVGAGIASALLTLGLVPVFELLGFLTDYKLLELANLNHPLLRQLMLRAPGTYHHSVIVGSLSEAACESIGANALLARVACYFHDIGKGVKPQYFVENQRDGNRHDRLSPAQSAQVIINHVRDGQLLALQYKLPTPIIDNIFMHHGTGIIQYFYGKAKEQNPGEPIDEALFRYPGPKPNTREAGIIMLADKVEAACRTIKDPAEPRIRAMIQQIINSVMSDGQFENCPLTLRELYQIADTFTNVLLGIYHHRIEYPDTRSISSGKGKFIPIPKQGTITLEIVNPLKAPPPPGSASQVGNTLPPMGRADTLETGRTNTLPPVGEKKAEDYERLENLPGGRSTFPGVDDS